MRLALVFAVVIHGLIHFIGFATAYNLVTVSALAQPISRPAGIFWFQAALLFLFVAAGMLMKKDWWWMLAIVAVILSQFLIIGNWQDAKVGTFLNVLILCAAIVGYADWKFYRSYRVDAHTALSKALPAEQDLITDDDLDRLPLLVQNYLRYTGVVNTPKLKNVKIEFDGEMRGRGKDWFPFHSEQYNTFDIPNRFFFMRARMKGYGVPGYHAYQDGVAQMTIRLFSMFPVVHNEGEVMNKAETVTILNDMCIMAPASLIDPRIFWEERDSESITAIFTHKGITVSAQLYFNEKGQLINFISDDRYDVSGDKPQRLRFSTPMSNYRNFHGINVPAYGEAIWHDPEGEFVYGKFYLRDIQYNVK
jgi:hypothetical protein